MIESIMIFIGNISGYIYLLAIIEVLAFLFLYLMPEKEDFTNPWIYFGLDLGQGKSKTAVIHFSSKGILNGNWLTLAPLYYSPSQAPDSPGIVTTYNFPIGRSEEYPATSEGIRAGEVTGWRAWYVYGNLLHSMGVSRYWLPGVPMQGNVREWGVHAFKTKEQALQFFRDDIEVVVGSVEMWGEIVEHENGYRSEYAAIASIDEYILPNFDDDAIPEKELIEISLNALRKTYGLK